MYKIMMNLGNTVLEGKVYDYAEEAEKACAGLNHVARINGFSAVYFVMELVPGSSWIKAIETEQTGGGCMVDTVTLTNGIVLSLTDESVIICRNRESLDLYRETCDEELCILEHSFTD